MELGDQVEGAEAVEAEMQQLQNQALRKCTGAAYGSSGVKVERITGVESVNTIINVAQTRFFPRAVADPTAIGDLWPASINPANNDEGWGAELEGPPGALGLKQQDRRVYLGCKQDCSRCDPGLGGCRLGGEV